MSIGKYIPKKETSQILELLRERYDYNPDTGVFVWKINFRGSTIKKGDIAGYIICSCSLYFFYFFLVSHISFFGRRKST